MKGKYYKRICPIKAAQFLQTHVFYWTTFDRNKLLNDCVRIAYVLQLKIRELIKKIGWKSRL